MSSIESAFAENGSMAHKNVHVGHLFVHDTLTVDNQATFKEGAIFNGDLIAN